MGKHKKNRINKQIFLIDSPSVKILKNKWEIGSLPDNQLNWDARRLYDEYFDYFRTAPKVTLSKYLSILKSDLEVITTWGIGGFQSLVPVIVGIASILCTFAIATFTPFYVSTDASVSKLAMNITMGCLFTLFIGAALFCVWPLRSRALKRGKIVLFISMCETIIGENRSHKDGGL